MRSNDNLIANFDTYLLAEKRVSQNTFQAYKRDIEQLQFFLNNKKLHLSNCCTDTLKEFIASLKRKGMLAKTLSRKISTLKLFFNFLNKNFDVHNSADNLVFPKLGKNFPVFLSDEEIEILFATADNDVTSRGIRNKVIIYLLYASGMRVSELVNLTVSQIHFDTGFIRLMGKGNKERVVPLPAPMLKLLSYYLNEVRKEFINKGSAGKNNYIFISARKENKPLTRQSIWNILKQILHLSGIKKKISPHSLRHSIATHLLKNGANLRSLQLLLGHEQLSTVQIYTHLDKSHLRKIYDKSHPRS